MADISFNRSAHKPQFRSSAAWLHILGSADARGAEVLIDATAECTITQEEEAYDPIDDSGQMVPGSSVVKAVKVEMKFLGSDAKIRQMFTGTGDQSVKGKFFGLTLQLADYITDAGVVTTGYYTFYKVRISKAGTWALGSNSHGYMLTAICYPNKTCASYTATLPTGDCFKPVAASAAIAADEFYYTEDGALT